jgi:hypothetical protein
MNKLSVFIVLALLSSTVLAGEAVKVCGQISKIEIDGEYELAITDDQNGQVYLPIISDVAEPSQAEESLLNYQSLTRRTFSEGKRVCLIGETGIKADGFTDLPTWFETTGE